MEDYQVVGEVGKALAANQSIIRSENQWKAFEAALNEYYRDPSKLGTLPPALSTTTEYGVKVNLRFSLDNYRRRGIPQACPEGTRQLIEFYTGIGSGALPHTGGARDPGLGTGLSADGYASTGSYPPVPSAAQYTLYAGTDWEITQPAQSHGSVMDSYPSATEPNALTPDQSGGLVYLSPHEYLPARRCLPASRELCPESHCRPQLESECVPYLLRARNGRQHNCPDTAKR